MKRCDFVRSITLALVCFGFGGASSATAQDRLVRTELPLKNPRSREPVLGGAKDKVFFQVWLPADVKVVRGAICNPFSRDEPPGKHWQAVARHWQFAFLHTDFDAVKKDEFGLLETALVDLAKKSGHPELAHLPLCFTGMSRGGGMTMQLAERMPQRTIACAPVCLEVGPASEATRQIPVVTVFGEKDGKQMFQLLGKLPLEREQGARWGLAPQWGRGHEFGQANNLGFVFFDDVIGQRLPTDSSTLKAPANLLDIKLDAGWIGDPADWKKEPARVVASPDFKGDRTQVCWLPSKRTAAVWQAFVSPHAKQVRILEPAGLGDKQPFVLHPAGTPVKVRAAIDDKPAPKRVQLWDGDLMLAERLAAPWDFEVSLKSGVHSLIVCVMGDEQPTRRSRPHTIVVADK